MDYTNMNKVMMNDWIKIIKTALPECNIETWTSDHTYINEIESYNADDIITILTMMQNTISYILTKKNDGKIIITFTFKDLEI